MTEPWLGPAYAGDWTFNCRRATTEPCAAAHRVALQPAIHSL